MTDRLGTHLLKRLRHGLEREAIDRAVEADILMDVTREVDGAQVLGFAAHPLMLQRTPLELERLVARLGSRDGSWRSGTRSMDFDDDTYVVEADSSRRLRKDKEKQGSASHSRPGGRDAARYQRLTTRLLSEVRKSADRPHPADVATVLLLARAVSESGLPLAEVLRVLRTPRPIITVIAAVPGFEGSLLNLLAQGLILPGRVGLASGYELSGGRIVRFSSRSTDRWHVVMFPGIKFDPDEPGRIARAVDRAALVEHPILGVAETEERLPERLTCAAQLRLATGPLDATLVRKVIAIVQGEEPVGSLSDESCALLTLSDLSIAIRPGVTASAVLRVLAQIAAMKDADPGAGEGKRGGDLRGESSSSKRASKSGRGDPGSGSEIIQPIPLTGGDSDRFIARVETLFGYGEATEWALSLKADLELWHADELPWEEMSTRLLLSGPPGTGKTTFARALCNSLQVPLIATSVATWMEPGYFGDVLKRMKAAFAEAESVKPSILFVDELDGIGIRRQRGEWAEYTNGTINRLLELLDGTTRSSGVIVVAATNHPHMIDPALLRSGRLEKQIEIPPPDTEALVGILRHHLKDDLDAVIGSAPTANLKSAGAGQAEADPSVVADEGGVTSESRADDPEAAAAKDGLKQSPEAADSTSQPATATVSRAEIRESHHHTTGVTSHGDV